MQALADSAERLLADHCTPERVRSVEAGASPAPLWAALQQSGFLDALVPEVRGGAGLSLRDVFPLLCLCGKYAVPVPLAQTLVVRALLAAAGAAIPDGPLTLAGAGQPAGRGINRSAVPYGRVAEWLLTEQPRGMVLLPLAGADVQPTGVHGSLEADVSWQAVPAEAVQLDRAFDLRALGASLYAAQLAGAMGRVLDITVRYAGERVQFGRPIGKFQAIQQQLSVMAEQVFAARMAAQMACYSASHLPEPNLAAVGKARASEAAATVASIAHAVHGAMGITGEYALQLYTRRLHEWRLAYGAETYWSKKIGSELLASSDTTLDFIRARLYPPDF